MDPERFQSICSYVGFDRDSSAVLGEFLRHAEAQLPGVVDDFYSTVDAHPLARRLIDGGPPQVERLKRALLDWLRAVLGGPHDGALLEANSRLGRTHVLIGVPQELMLMAMSRIRARLLEIVEARFASEARLRARYSSAINQILDLELAVMLDGYREQSTEHARDSERILSEQRHREIIESVPVFALVLDESGKILLWNAELEQVTGLSRDEMLGRDGSELVPHTGDHKLPLKNGGHRLARWRRTDVRATSGTTLTYALGLDVTEERDAMRRRLQAERLAAVGTLATGLAHEVRNPLNSASLQVKVLEGRLARGNVDSASLRAVLQLIQEEVLRVENLLSDFLSIAQPQPLQLKRVDLNALLAREAKALQPSLAQVSLETELDPSVGEVELDPVRVGQVVSNLLRNAAEAANEGGRIWLRSRAVDSGGFVAVEVEDTGPGFSSDAPIFDAFYTTKPTGTGLGLSLAHRIVGDHGGTLRASSGNGRTCFAFRLPQHSRLT